MGDYTGRYTELELRDLSSQSHGDEPVGFRTLYPGGHPRFYEILQKQAELHDRKNTDYAKGSAQGALGNFHRTSTIMQLYPGMNWTSPEGIALNYMLKQLDAALVLKSTNRNSVTGEPFEARMLDVAVYANLAIILSEAQCDKSKDLPF